MFGTSSSRFVSGLVLLLLLQLGQSSQAFGQNVKKDDPPKADASTDKDKETKKPPKLVYVGTYVGKLTKLEEDGFKMEVGTKYKQTLELLVNDDVKVRMPVDIEFDDKGRPKRMKKDPNDKDSRLGGIKGAREDLAHNQEIQVSVSRLPNRKLVATVVKVLKKP